MAKFIYGMQNVLNIKERLETQAKTEYAQMSILLSQEEDAMRTLVARMRAYEDELRGTAGGRLNVFEMKRCKDSIRVIKDQIAQQAIRIKIAERNLDTARESLNTAMQERKIQDKLKEKAFEGFKQELNSSEKKEIDEVVSFNYNDRGTDA
ncbi:MAG: flagellar export protein FliJ [Lachnospira sp.]|nr:flagellar export protein FliJ [Lachnospira sp.]